MTKTTAELVSGDMVRLPLGLVRTVDRITTSPYVNRANLPIRYVMYREGRTAEWGAGNSAIDSTVWTVTS